MPSTAEHKVPRTRMPVWRPGPTASPGDDEIQLLCARGRGREQAMHNPLHAPWRMEYIAAPKQDGPCIFCGVRDAGAEERKQRLVVCCGERAYVMLNRYPYAAGHLIVMPYEH